MKSLARTLVILGGILFSSVWSVYPQEAQDAGPCGKPPPPKPAQRSGAEGVPPLPLPATPMRRSEKKKPPTPPTVVVKISTGDKLDWATDENDINNLLVWMQAKLKITFAYEAKPLSAVKLDAARLPMLYRTGHNAFAFSPAERQALRDYILNGGLIFFDTCCGRKEFADSVRQELALIFPERPLHKLPPDHPMFHCYYDVPLVTFSPGAGIAEPLPPPIEGIDVGCRTAILFSPLDVSCGWDMHTHKTSAGIDSKHALRLGANFIAYATATKAMGVSLAESRVYVDKDQSKADKFRIGQIVHEAQWNPDTAALSTLLDTISSVTSVKVSFATQPLKLSNAELTSFPFLYLSGHDKLELSDEEILALGNYIRMGGFLFADSSCGREAFDKSFRQIIKRALPSQELAALDPSHPIFTARGGHYDIANVNYTQAALVMKKLANPTPPGLLGITIDDHLAVVYSPFDLGCGWELKPCPYCVGYESQDAVKLGVNVLLYAVTH